MPTRRTVHSPDNAPAAPHSFPRAAIIRVRRSARTPHRTSGAHTGSQCRVDEVCRIPLCVSYNNDACKRVCAQRRKARTQGVSNETLCIRRGHSTLDGAGVGAPLNFFQGEIQNTVRTSRWKILFSLPFGFT